VLLVSLLVGTGMNGGSTGGRGKDKGEREKIDHICYLKTPLCEVVSKDRFFFADVVIMETVRSFYHRDCPYI
jgi:hypothetical protein